jgi:hypothetical protein
VELVLVYRAQLEVDARGTVKGEQGSAGKVEAEGAGEYLNRRTEGDGFAGHRGEVRIQPIPVVVIARRDQDALDTGAFAPKLNRCEELVASYVRPDTEIAYMQNCSKPQSADERNYPFNPSDICVPIVGTADTSFCVEREAYRSHFNPPPIGFSADGGVRSLVAVVVLCSLRRAYSRIATTRSGEIPERYSPRGISSISRAYR